MSRASAQRQPGRLPLRRARTGRPAMSESRAASMQAAGSSGGASRPGWAHSVARIPRAPTIPASRTSRPRLASSSGSVQPKPPARAARSVLRRVRA